MAGGHVTTQHKPLVFVVWMKKRREVHGRGLKSIRLGMFSGNIVIEYKERLRAQYDQLSEEEKGLGEEWKKCG